MGRPLFAPPDLPSPLLAAMRQAFDRTMQDSEFIAAVKKLGFNRRPESGADLVALINRMAATPSHIEAGLMELTT